MRQLVLFSTAASSFLASSRSASRASISRPTAASKVRMFSVSSAIDVCSTNSTCEQRITTPRLPFAVPRGVPRLHLVPPKNHSVRDWSRCAQCFKLNRGRSRRLIALNRCPRRIERPDCELASRQRPSFIRSIAESRCAMLEKIVANLSCPSRSHNKCAPGGLGIAERTGERIMARKPYAPQINLGLGNVAGKFTTLETGIRSGKFARERLNLLRKYRI